MRLPAITTLTAVLLLGCVSGCTGGGAARPADAGVVGDSGPTTPMADAFDLPDARNPPFGIQFIDPDWGPFSGGTEVMVRGVGFRDGVDVRFGGRSVEPLDLEVIDSRRIRVVTPPGDPGMADVEVVLGADVATLPGGFRYEAMTVSPTSGSVAGGTFVTLTGLGTNWDATTVVTFDGQIMVNPTVVNNQTITGFTPPGTAGTADIRVSTGADVQEARRAYTYLTTVDPFFGGMAGGPIDGTVNVVVVDSNSRDGVPDAFVAIGDPRTTPFKGRADALGQITFSGPALTGPISLVVAADEYETAMFVEYDARDITVHLRKPPPPATGPFPPAPQGGRILGHVLFGNAVALGTPTWDLVPEPRTPTERKRLYVTTTSRGMFATSQAPDSFIDFEFDPQVTAWEYRIDVRPSAVAVVAVAGLYDSAKDPSGSGVSGFEPFAMGVTRGVLVGPGEQVIGVDVVVDTPLDSALRVTLDTPPLLGTPGWNGPLDYTVRPFIDFGGEGFVHMNKNGLPIPPVPEAPPNIYPIADGEQSVLLPSMAPLLNNFADASYSFIAGAFSQGGGSPFSVRIARGFGDIGLPLTIGDFLPMPRPVDPKPDTRALARHLVIAHEGDSTGQATFNLHMLSAADGTQLYRIFTLGSILEVDLPDLTAEGFPPLPRDEDIAWTTWTIGIEGSSFNQFTYRMLSSAFWSAYTADGRTVQFP